MITLGFQEIVPPPHTPPCSNTADHRTWRALALSATESTEFLYFK